MHILALILALYAWIVIGVLLVFLGRIGYFYEKTSGERVGYYLLLIPALLLAAGVTWYLVYNVEFTGQPLADLLLFGGGFVLFLFGSHLHSLMTGERR